MQAAGGCVIECASHALIAKLLEPGEHVVWLEKPPAWAVASHFMYPIVFMAAWTGSLIFAAVRDLSFPKPNRMDPNAVIAWVTLMLGMSTVFWYKFLTEFLNSWRTVYALTDRRVIVAAGNETLSYAAKHLGDIWVSGGNERGSLNFWGKAWRVKWFGGFPDRHYPHGLFGITGPDRVKALIQETLIKPQNRGNAT
jgi:hypothetical protein